jgi:hypothetical protein
VLLATACSPSERAEQAREVASRFLQAAGGNDPTTACGLLAPRTAEDLPEDCAQALEDWPGPTEITEVAVWGDRAQAKSGDSALFLAEFNDGWRVVAAGCVPRGENLPYQCTVGGA